MASGFGIGKVFLFTHNLPHIPEYEIEVKKRGEEVKKFERVIEKVEEELLSLKQRINSERGKDLAEFISIQLALLRDKEVLQKTEERITEKGYNAERAYSEVITEITQPLMEVSQPFFRERVDDIRDVANRVIRNFLSIPHPSILEAPPDSIVCLLYTSPSPRDRTRSRMPSSA